MTEPTPRPDAEMSTTLHRWTLAVLSGLGVILVLIIVATLAISGTQRPAPRPINKIVHVTVSGAVPVASVDYLSVSPGIKPGPDGQLHDAYSQTTFYVHAGRPMKLVIDNTDNVPHGIVSAAAGVALLVKPGTHTYTLLVKRPGVYQWHCDQPCDPYSMTHVGYMMGTIIAE